MWTRKQLKDKGRVSFRANYWRAVLVAIIIAMVLGGGVGICSTSSCTMTPGVPFGMQNTQPGGNSGGNNGTGALSDDRLDGLLDELEDRGVDIGDLEDSSMSMSDDGITLHSDDGSSMYIGKDGIDIHSDDGSSVHIDGDTANELGGLAEEMSGPAGFAITAGITFAAIIAMLIVLALAFAIDAFLCNPIEIGTRRFFLSNLNRKAEIREVAFGFDHNYLSGVKTMFLRDLFVFLWSLLFIIPGIVKSYEYRMIPYLIAEHPEMDHKTAFEQSKLMMNGQKWDTFVLDLSFIGWWILSALTLGILSVFYVGPYYAATSAALYEALRYGEGASQADGQPVSPQDPFATYAASQSAAIPNMAEQPAWATGEQTEQADAAAAQESEPQVVQPQAEPVADQTSPTPQNASVGTGDPNANGPVPPQL